KIRIEGYRRAARGSDVKVYFDIDGQNKLTVQCFAHDPEDLGLLQSGKEYKVLGKIDKFIPGRPIPLRDSFFVDQGVSNSSANQKVSMIFGGQRQSTTRDSPPELGRASLEIHTGCTIPENCINKLPPPLIGWE